MYQAQDFRGLIGLPGFSDALLTNHFTLYEGYVKNVNLLEEKLETLRKADQMATPEYAELKRRFGWEYNGMRLHELYFSNLTKTPETLDSQSGLFEKIEESFGSFEAWEKDFRATGAMRGIGWVILFYDVTSGTLRNAWIDEHDTGLLVGNAPLLVMDVFEHAFVLDYGIKRADYIEAFWKAIRWEKVAERFELALQLQKIVVEKQ